MSRLDAAIDSFRSKFEDLVEELREESREDAVEVVIELEAVDGPALSRKRAFVAGRRVRFDNGTGRISVAPGTRRLLWDVQGKPGQTYRIAITAPPSAAWERTSGITDDGDDGGIHKFEVR